MIDHPRTASRAVQVVEISKSFGSVTAVEPTSFVVPAGAFVTLLGPSGSGKTTILKVIAGFEEPTSGQVLLSGTDVTTIPPHKRNLGFVFQQYALFPHLTVAENIAYPLRMRRLAREQIRRRVTETIGLIRLNGLEERRPAQLSGGQQQRVALARAIVFQPPLLLMDEPMSALDKRLREEMQFEVRRLQRRLGITTIAVTHDQVEALVMSDVIIVLNKGRIEQSGRPDDVYRSPRSEFVANFLGESNLFRGSIEENDSAPVLVCGANVRIPVGQIAGANRGARVVYVVRPECVAIDASPAPGQIAIRGRVTEAIFAGEAIRVTIESGLGTPVVAKILSNASTVLPRASDEVTVSWLPADAAIFPE